MAPTIAHVVVTNGRQDYLEKTMQQCFLNVGWDNLKLIGCYIVDDSGDPKYREWLAARFPRYEIVPVGDTPQGYARAMKTVWKTVKRSGADYVFHLEDDFLFRNPVMLSDLVTVLQDDPGLAEVAFVRQPWFQNEIRHGGLIKALEVRQVGPFTDMVSKSGINYIKHRAGWTTNPCVYPRWVTNYRWPNGTYSEPFFGKELLKNPKIAFAYYGHKEDKPRCEHIGVVKMGNSTE